MQGWFIQINGTRKAIDKIDTSLTTAPILSAWLRPMGRIPVIYPKISIRCMAGVGATPRDAAGRRGTVDDNRLVLFDQGLAAAAIGGAIAASRREAAAAPPDPQPAKPDAAARN